LARSKKSTLNYSVDLITHPATILKSLYPSLVWEMPTQEPTLYITFDDGPTKGVTDALLDLLKAHQAKATFFCIGKNVQKNPELFQRILNEGHRVGNHTFSHLNGWKSTNMSYLKDVEKCRSLFESSYFRPPYGRLKPAQIASLKKRYKIIMWSALSMDYHPSVSKEKCYQNSTAKISSGDILVFHDSEKAADKMFYAVEKLLTDETFKGYRFLPLP